MGFCVFALIFDRGVCVWISFLELPVRCVRVCEVA